MFLNVPQGWCIKCQSSPIWLHAMLVSTTEESVKNNIIYGRSFIIIIMHFRLPFVPTPIVDSYIFMSLGSVGRYSLDQ